MSANTFFFDLEIFLRVFLLDNTSILLLWINELLAKCKSEDRVHIEIIARTLFIYSLELKLKGNIWRLNGVRSW